MNSYNSKNSKERYSHLGTKVEPIIRLQNITYFYPNTDKPALDRVNLKINQGEYVILTGPSGGGKSTLCRLINGLIPHFYGGRLEGKVIVDGIDVKNSSVSELSKHVGMVFQNPQNQIVNLIVEEEIAFGLENMMYPEDLIEERIKWVLEILGIQHLRYRTTNSLSGGELQKVALASVLALKPKILVLDEPTSNMDPYSAREFLRTLYKVWKNEQITILMVEHRLSEAIQYANRIILLDKKIIAEGPPKDIIASNTLEEMGIESPPVSKLAKKIGVNPIPINIEEATEVLGKWIMKH